MANGILNVPGGGAETAAPSKNSFIADWDAAVTYAIGDGCYANGQLYKSLLDANLAQDPATATAYWKVSGAITLTDLEDVPDSYVNMSGKVLAVNETENGIGFADAFFIDGGTIVEDFEGVTPIFPRIGADYARIAGGANGSNFCLASGAIDADQSVAFTLSVPSDGLLKFWYKARLEWATYSQPYVNLDGVTIKSGIFNTDWAEFVFAITQGVHMLEFHSGTPSVDGWWSQLYIDNISIPAERIYKHAIHEHEGTPSMLGQAGKLVKVNPTSDGLAYEAVTKAEIEAALTGEISTHTHAAVNPSKNTYLADWDATITYETGDGCYCNGQLYKSLQTANIAQDPVTATTYWELFVSGPAGPQGIQGEPGLTGSQGIQGEIGPQGIQGIQGEVGPQGIQGLQGEPGLAGAEGSDGLSAYQVAVNNGYVGTEAEWVASLSLVPTELTGDAGKVLMVNATEDGLSYENAFYSEGGYLVEDFELGYPLIERTGNWVVSPSTPHSGVSALRAPTSLAAGTTSIETFTLDSGSSGTLSFWYIINDGANGQLKVYLDDALVLTDNYKTTYQKFESGISVGPHTLRLEYYLYYSGGVNDVMAIDQLSLPGGRIYKHDITQHDGMPKLTGGAGKALTVNETENGLVLVDIASAATNVSVTDAGAYYTGTDAESVLQEIGTSLSTKAAADHTHAELTTKTGVEAVLTGEISTHTHAPVHELPIGGTAGQVLSKVDATDYNATWADASGGGATVSKAFPSWITRVSRNALQTIGGTWTSVNWDTETFDTAGAWNIEAPTRITVPAGKDKLQLKAYLCWKASAAGGRLVDIRKNGTETLQVAMQNPINESGQTIDTGWLTVAPGDYFEIYVYSYSGVDLNGNGWGGASWVEATFSNDNSVDTLFTDLADTPDTYVGAAGKALVVNETETGLSTAALGNATAIQSIPVSIPETLGKNGYIVAYDEASNTFILKKDEPTGGGGMTLSASPLFAIGDSPETPTLSVSFLGTISDAPNVLTLSNAIIA